MECFEELSGCQDLDLADVSEDEQVLVAGDDDVGVGREGRFDEPVIVAVPGDRDGLGWGDVDSGQGEEL